MPLRLAFESGRPHQKTDGLLLRESTLPPVCPVPRRSAGGRSGLGHEREVCWPTDGVDRQVNVQRWPIEVVWGGVLDRGDLVHGGLLEPRELFEGEVQLFFTQQQPEAVLGDVRDFNRRSDVARHLGFPWCELERRLVPR